MAAHPVDFDRHDLVETNVLEARRGFAVQRELDQVCDEAVELVDLVDHGTRDGVLLVLPHPAAFEQLGIRADARQRGAELVGRVGDQPALRGQRAIEGDEHLVEGRSEARDLVVAFLVEPDREVTGAGDVLDGPGQAPHGCKRLLGDPATDRDREQHGAERDDRQDEPQPAERCLVVGQRSGDLKRLARADVRRQHSHAGALDRDGLGQRAGSGGDRPLTLPARELGHLVRGAHREALGRERLHELARRRDDRPEAAPARTVGASSAARPSSVTSSRE